ncbi:Clavaminate synthase-like protein, partial [Lophiostoma macrostomum CBS 122681]
MESAPRAIPILNLSKANDSHQKQELLEQLRDALFVTGFLYVRNHGVDTTIISDLVARLPALFDIPSEAKSALSKMNSPHFLGYSGYAEETTLGQKDLREQFDFATELPVIWDKNGSMKQNGAGTDSFSELFWRLRGPNQWPSEAQIPGFRAAFTEYHDALQELSYRFVHLVEEAFGIPVGTFDAFFPRAPSSQPLEGDSGYSYVCPQHRIKLLKYPPSSISGGSPHDSQGVGAHKDSSGWLTFLYQIGQEEGLEVLDSTGAWISAPPIHDTFVVNFGNAFEAATEGAIKATVHRVKAPLPTSNPRYSIPFFQGLPLDLSVSEIQSFIPEDVKKLRSSTNGSVRAETVSSFLDPRWDSLGHSQLRKWIRSHKNVGRKFYGDDVVDFY